MQTDTGLLKLHGAASLEGQAEPPNAALLVPLVGIFIVLHHGKDAIIKPGTPFTAYLDSSSLVASMCLDVTSIPKNPTPAPALSPPQSPPAAHS